MDPIFHLALIDEWDRAVANGGPYERSTIGRSLAEEGFIHCSTAAQVVTTAERFYSQRDDVLVLEIDPTRLGVEVRHEDLVGAGEEFPHVYGPLPLAAVVDEVPLSSWRIADSGP